MEDANDPAQPPARANAGRFILLADIEHDQMLDGLAAAVARASCSKQQALRIGGVARGHDFDGNLAADSQVARSVDFAMPAGAKRREDLGGSRACPAVTAMAGKYLTYSG